MNGCLLKCYLASECSVHLGYWQEEWMDSDIDRAAKTVIGKNTNWN